MALLEAGIAKAVTCSRITKPTLALMPAHQTLTALQALAKNSSTAALMVVLMVLAILHQLLALQIRNAALTDLQETSTAKAETSIRITKLSLATMLALQTLTAPTTPNPTWLKPAVMAALAELA